MTMHRITHILSALLIITMPALAMKVPLHVDARAAGNWEEAH